MSSIFTGAELNEPAVYLDAASAQEACNALNTWKHYSRDSSWRVGTWLQVDRCEGGYAIVYDDGTAVTKRAVHGRLIRHELAEFEARGYPRLNPLEYLPFFKSMRDAAQYKGYN